ncbi:hypothetical protein BJP25_00715 [Actinokineospora bangkokensis]|uniref:OmpR/PhoB-type domain-containing protein n=1 Tax=Actinokineospora bangkokensis TaxID=1193682 RepID=A0A1Q9LHH7_9PSEU|nr:hypothetical protein BJP25_00715 [Actinokineospora bangkokensis]
MRVLVLGPVEVRGDDGPVSTGGPKPRALLAALAVQPRQVVSVSRLVDLIWDEAPPQSATALVHTYVSAVRRGFAAAGEPGALVTRAPGYLLDLADADTDLGAFEGHLAAARRAERAGDDAGAVRAYEAALALWRGPAFGGVDAGFARVRADGLAEERLAAEEGRARAGLALGRARELTEPLRRLVAAHPLREEARGLLMRALVGIGRQVDALAVYREGRKHLLDELGIEPGEALRDLHARVLAGELAPQAAPAPVAAAPVPRTLPPDVPDFTGRAAVLGRLLEVGGRRHDRTPIVVVSGAGGAGKSALAVHAAHRLRAEYPDGQLWADLRGAERELGAFEVLGRFLTAFGVSGSDLPGTEASRAELFRSAVAGRRVLLVLDNARGEHQVRPLLPGEPGCLVLVTSRSRLTGLAGAVPVELGFFDTGVATEMLAKVVGEHRVAAQRAQAERIADLCGGVPLAIRAAAARLLARPHWPLRSLADRLADERRRLDELAVGDLAIRSSLGVVYDELTARQRRAFHLLAVLDLPDFGWWAAVPLLDLPPADAEDVVEQLVDLRLLDVAGVDALGRVRYRFHDLVQLFGAERALADEPPEVVPEAVRRTLGTWLALVEAGSRQLPRVTLGLRPRLAPGVEVDPVLLAEVAEDPTGWLGSETAAVVRTVERAHELGVDGLGTLLIASLLSSPFAARNEFDGWQRTHDVALSAARRRGDRRAEAVVLAGLGQLHYEKDDFTAALDHFRQARAHAEAVGDEAVLAVAAVGIGTVRRDLADFAAAADDLRAAVELGERVGDRSVVAAAYYGLGAISRDHGDLAQAVERFDACARLYRELDDRRGEGLALRGLSLCHRAAGDAARAVELSERAVQVLGEAGDVLGTTYARQSWAKAKLRTADPTGAAAALADCLRESTDIGDRFGIALATRTLGEHELAWGDPAAAAALLRAALDRWAELDLPLWQARTLRDLAAADPAAADEHWARAIELFTACQAREADELAATTPAGWLRAVRAHL